MKKFCRFTGLILSVIMVLGLNGSIPASAEMQYLPLIDMNEFYAHEITFDDLFFAYPNQTKYPVEFESDYIKSIFSVDNLVFVREELSKEIKEKPSVGDIHFYGANDVQGYVYFDEKSVFISKFVPDSSNKRDSQTYQGWFTYKNMQVYQKLIEYLKQQGEKELQKREEVQNKPLKNQVSITDVEILYETFSELRVNGSGKYWGVLSYTKEGQRIIVPFLSGTRGYQDGKREFYIAKRTVKDNTFFIDMNKALITYDGGVTGREYDSENKNIEYTIKVNVTAEGKAESLTCNVYSIKFGTEEIKQFDLRAQSQTGTLPKELFTPEDNVSDLKETKSEDKKEELNVKEETPEELADDKKQEEKKEKDATEKQDEKTPASDEKENITDDTQKNEKPEEQSDEQPPAENNYPKHIQAMNDWAQPYVKRATDMGWLIEDIFSGDLQRDMRREDFCVLAEHMLGTCGIDTAVLSLGIPPFSDTQNQSVNALYRLGIVKGKTSVEFAPTDSITREEAATILYRMCKVLEIKDVYMDYRLSGYMFADTESFSDWAAESIYNIYLHGVMQGIGDDFFDPKSPYSMEQAITTMIRLYDKKEAEK